eukprot:CAMPEP_0196741760 /NCGR_PEP_ID=MMETSP1091-20130531/42521_1 /TAXON_ID=302021 /ORGANISM="Rhodomonas sp., Strain CCMP768" /LENGTH=50 /DNA_ID=CAMNT_0042087577 /DNA_START=1 /DNA_END=153 /DNA_ORIENTATION=+
MKLKRVEAYASYAKAKAHRASCFRIPQQPSGSWKNKTAHSAPRGCVGPED